MTISSKDKHTQRLILFVLLGIFMLPVSLKAQESIKVGSTTRQMIVYAPSSIKQNCPLIITMHGMNQTMTDQKNQTSFQPVADANGFILVYPQSNGTTWDLNGTSDINFILAIIDEMYKRYGIDRDRVYLSGFSMGGMMCYYAATKIADKIAAIAPVSGFLMSGPNAVSSRPIPIMHLHGMNDNFVPYSNVQAHIDAWVKRNGCPPAVVTNPFSDPKSIKKYYGPGKEGVEVVFIGVSGVDHWYSNGTGGVVSSQEIWNFCKKYSLKEGVPEFKYASVTENAPSQIKVELSNPIVAANNYTGFTLKIDGTVASIDSVVQCDSNKVAINLRGAIQKDNAVTLSYSNGNVVSVGYEKKLVSFSDILVDNLLVGASPTIVEVKTEASGDVLLVKFNKKMQLPSDVLGIALNAEYNGQLNIPILQGSFFNNDSTTLSFPLGEKVYRDYKLSVSYSGTAISSADEGLLKAVSGLTVSNNSNGLPVYLVSGAIGADGVTLSLEFSKLMKLTSTQSAYFELKVNGASVGFYSYSVSGKTIQFVLKKSVYYGDTVTISNVFGNITADDNGPLEGLDDFAVFNKVTAPKWIAVPGKVEAENFTFKYGMQAETTGDIGGGQNLGYITDGDWVEYAIENKGTQTTLQISFRLAATSSNGVIYFYIDDVYCGEVNAPNTGNWQVYQSIVKNIDIAQGKHYLKVVATKAGFNLNYMEIKDPTTGVESLTDMKITIYPNPVSNELNIDFAGLKHSKIEVFDATGKLQIEKLTLGESFLRIPVILPNGVYTLRLSNNEKFKFKKFVIENK
jgi:uncharacterized repeat protein (TIGR02059 family)